MRRFSLSLSRTLSFAVCAGLLGVLLSGCGEKPAEAKKEHKKPAGVRVANLLDQSVELTANGQMCIGASAPDAIGAYQLIGVKNQKLEAKVDAKAVFTHELTPESWRGYTVVLTKEKSFLVEKEIRDSEDDQIVVTFVNATGSEATFKLPGGKTVTVQPFSGTEPTEVEVGGFKVEASSSAGKATIDQPLEQSHGYSLFFTGDRLILKDNKPNRKPVSLGSPAPG